MTVSAINGKMAFALRNVDTQDIEWLRGRLAQGGNAQSGHGQFWMAVLRELESAMRGHGASADKEKA